MSRNNHVFKIVLDFYSVLLQHNPNHSIVCSFKGHGKDHRASALYVVIVFLIHFLNSLLNQIIESTIEILTKSCEHGQHNTNPCHKENSNSHRKRDSRIHFLQYQWMPMEKT